MIKLINKDRIILLIAKYLSYASSCKFSSSVIELNLIKSRLINSLEDSDDYLLYQEDDEILADLMIDDFNHLIINKDDYWVALAYVELFFEYKRTFEYLFTMIPLEKMRQLYSLYHEMDISQLFAYFTKIIEHNHLLAIILKKRNLTLKKLSQLTNISKNTLANYMRDDNNLLNASLKNILKIADILKINIKNLAQLNIVIDTSIYEFDKKDLVYRSFLGFYLLDYFKKIDANRYHYNKKDNNFIDGKNKIIIDLTTINKGLSTIKPSNEELLKICDKYKDNSNTILLIFEYNQKREEIKNIKELLKYQFKAIYIINQCYLFDVNKRGKRYLIYDDIEEALIYKARELGQTV